MQHIYNSEKESISFIELGIDFKNIRFDYFRDNKRVVKEAVKNQGAQALQYASKHLRDDKDFVFELISQNGACLEYVSKRLKNDIEIVFLACEQKESFIKYASEDLQNLCSRKNVLKTLESFIFTQQLDDQLNKKQIFIDKKTKI